MAISSAWIRRRLLGWYDREQRRLPWRNAKAGQGRNRAYRVWVSEIMLQQTQVTTVIPYYQRFLQRFPNAAALAAAPEDDVLALWSGLGYYRRARQLHAAAAIVVSRHLGEFPRERAAAEALPGVGRYTAAAVLSIAYGQPLAAMDANGLRVARRLLGHGPGKAVTPAAAQRALDHWLAPRRAGDFNQALMDLGATVCRPREADCPRCPLRSRCAAPEGVPAPARSASPRRKLALRYGLARRGDAVWLVQRPRDAAQMAAMWELPELAAAAGAQLFSVRHAITTSDITAGVHALATPPPQSAGRWCSAADAARLPLTGLARKILRGAAAQPSA